MTLFDVTATLILVSTTLGLIALKHAAAWKLSTESINSPKFLVRWIYRYLIFSFWFGFSFLLVGPVTTWQLIEIPAIATFDREHSWLLLVLTVLPALVLYYLHLKFVIWGDPAKIRARKRLSAKLASSGRR